MTPTDFMLLVGGIILIGFLADLFYKKTYIPDSIILILLGMLLGHFTGLLPPSVFVEFAGFMASIAVAIILYDTGLNLDLVTILKESGPSFLLGTVSYVLSAAFITIAAHLFLGWDLLSALILGTMLGGTSAAVVATVAQNLPIDERTKAILNVESTLTNAYALVFVLTLLNFALSGDVNLLDALHLVVASLSISILVGLVAGVLWLGVLMRIRHLPYVQMLTLGIMFLLYALTEYLKGIGALTSFIFGLVLGNARTVKQMFFLEGEFKISSLFRRFNDEISFFIRIFFFTFLGIIFVPPEDLHLYLFAILVTVMALIARYVAAVVARVENTEIVTVSIPRGLSEAVVASLLVSMGFPKAYTYLQIASLVILLTNIATAVLLAYVVRALFKRPSPA